MLGTGEKRSISKEMENNRGLTRVRNKLTKNPRKKMREKYNTALKKRRGAVRKPVDKSKPYAGERTGINPRVTKSKKF